MSAAVVLDAEALHALAHPLDRRTAARRAQAVLQAALQLRAVVRVPAAVLVEAYRGTRTDAAIDRVLARAAGVITTGRAIARTAGELLHRHGLDSCSAVDACVVATAIRLGGAVVATSDAGDLRRLAGGHANVEILALS